MQDSTSKVLTKDCTEPSLSVRDAHMLSVPDGLVLGQERTTAHPGRGMRFALRSTKGLLRKVLWTPNLFEWGLF